MKKRLVAVILLVFVVGLSVFLPRALKITSIDCKSQYGPCDIELTKEITQLRGKNYLEAKKKLGKILVDNSKVKSFSLSFTFPQTFTINLVQTKAIAAIYENEEYVLLNDTGLIVSEVSETDLPTAVVTPNSSFDAQSHYIFVANLMQKMFLVYGVKIAVIEKDYINFDLNMGKKIYFPLEGDVDILMGSLQVILSRLNSESDYRIIDLRFKNPIIK